MFMTEDQKKYYKAMKRMQSKSPIKAIPRPTVSVEKSYPCSMCLTLGYACCYWRFDLMCVVSTC